MTNPLINTVTKIGGTTLKATWVNSGVIPSSISSALLDNADVLVSSVAATSSLNGFYYALLPVPNTRAWYVNEWIAIINANTYRDRQFVRAVLPEVS